MIIFRYLAKEVFSTSAAVTSVLLMIFLSNQFIRYLSITAAGKLPAMQIFYMLLLEVPQLLSVLLPLGLFIGITLAYGRMYAESEMVVLTACGMSQKQLLSMTSLMAAVVFIVVAFLSFWLAPYVATTRDQVLDKINAASELQTLMPGSFQAGMGGQRIYYVGSMSSNRQQLKNIFEANQVKSSNPFVPDVWNIAVANSGYYYKDPVTHDQFIVANQGQSYQGVPGDRNFRVMNFQRYGMRIEAGSGLIADRIDSAPTALLWKQLHQHKLAANVELQQRLAMPLMVLLLTSLAIPLCRVKPRQGKYAKLFPSVLIYIIYANMILVAQVWLGEGLIKPGYGLWWIHGALLIVIILLFGEQLGWYRLLKIKFARTTLFSRLRSA